MGTGNLNKATAEEVKRIVVRASELVLQHNQRSPTSVNATMGESEALFNLSLEMRLVREAVAQREP